MGYWNYRVYKDRRGEFGIIECYYDDNDIPHSHTGFVMPYGIAAEELKQELEWMLKAFERPILTKEDFPNGH